MSAEPLSESPEAGVVASRPPADEGMPATGRRPLRVAAVYPAFDPVANELAQVWAALARDGQVECRLIAGAKDNLKGHAAELQASLPGLEIRRIDGSLHSRRHAPELIDDELIRWAAELRPDVVVSSCDFLADYGRRIRDMHLAPHLLHVEQWFSPLALARREYLGIRPLRSLALRLKHRRFDAIVDHYMIANPAERAAMRAATDPSRYDYVAWPHPPLAGVGEPPPLAGRDTDRLVYIGSMSHWKGAANLGRYIDAFLAAVPDARVTLVGPPGDKVARRALARVARWGDRCTHIPSLPRSQALRLIGESLAVFCPSDAMGWGLVGDAFNMGTPVIGVGDFYELRDGVNGLVATEPAALARCFERLRGDPALWSRLAEAGRRCVLEEHSPQAVEQSLLQALRRAADSRVAR
ncbi:MAG: glycosyltransferase family 4 protein [Burkholderiaceae bacterium]